MPVTVDPRVELMSIVFRLAGNPEYQKGRVDAYTNDVETHFGPWREHNLVKMARSLRKSSGVSYDAVMDYAVHLTAELEPVLPFSSLAQSLDGRWRPKAASAFQRELKRFAQDTDFPAFFAAHQPLYSAAVVCMQDVVRQHGHLDWFDRFFGAAPGARFNLILGMLNGGNCYGARTAFDGQAEELYCILGVWSTDDQGRPSFNQGMLATVAHEFCHAYVNPLVYQHKAQLRKSGTQLYARVAARMREQAYGTWSTMMHESLVRASVVCYLRTHEGEQAAEREIARQVDSRHFLWMPELVDLLTEYEAQREIYPDFASFFPRIIRFFDDYTPGFVNTMQAKTQHAPRIVSMHPRNGATDVDPGLDTLSIRFSERMHGGYSFVGGGPHYPQTLGKPRYHPDHKTISLQVKLKPNWTYEFWLNRGQYRSFRNEKGIPLEPVHVRFSTGPHPEK